MPWLAHVKAQVSRGFAGLCLETPAGRPLLREDGGTDIKRPGHSQAPQRIPCKPQPDT
jgi:hypothetical protein